MRFFSEVCLERSQSGMPRSQQLRNGRWIGCLEQNHLDPHLVYLRAALTDSFNALVGNSDALIFGVGGTTPAHRFERRVEPSR